MQRLFTSLAQTAMDMKHLNSSAQLWLCRIPGLVRPTRRRSTTAVQNKTFDNDFKVDEFHSPSGEKRIACDFLCVQKRKRTVTKKKAMLNSYIF